MLCRMDVAKEPVERAVSFVATAFGGHLQKGLRQLLAARMFTDVTLNVLQEDQAPVSVPAHKFVLSMASQEFKLLLCASAPLFSIRLRWLHCRVRRVCRVCRVCLVWWPNAHRLEFVVTRHREQPQGHGEW